MLVTKKFKVFSLISLSLLSYKSCLSMDATKEGLGQLFSAESAKIGVSTMLGYLGVNYGFRHLYAALYPKNTRGEKIKVNHVNFLSNVWKPTLASGIAMVSSMRVGPWVQATLSELYKPVGVAITGIGLATVAGGIYGYYKKKPGKSIDPKAAGKHFVQDDDREFKPLEKKQNALNYGMRAGIFTTWVAGCVGLPCWMWWQRK